LSFLNNKLRLAKKGRNRKIQLIKELGYGKMPTSILAKEIVQTDIILNKQNKTYGSNASIDRNMLFFYNKVKKDHPDISNKYAEKMVLENFTQKARNCRSKSSCLSIFPQKIGRLLVKFYSKKGDTVFDCFAGHNSRMQLVHSCKRHYIGVDICKEFIKENRIIKERLLKNEKQELIQGVSCKITLIEGSSARVKQIENKSADFTITSPPYWNIEWYGDEKEQLGKAKTYQEFLDRISLHIKENYRILKRGSYCVWCVNDFVKKGVYYCYHSDLINLFTKAGFTTHAVYIIDIRTSLGIAFVQTVLKTMRFPKQHEYILVFRKD